MGLLEHNFILKPFWLSIFYEAKFNRLTQLKGGGPA